jgi:hypothetical protein
VVVDILDENEYGSRSSQYWNTYNRNQILNRQFQSEKSEFNHKGKQNIMHLKIMHPISGRKKWFVFARNVFNTWLEILIIFILEAGCMLLGNS